MKKIYICPASRIFNVHTSGNLLLSISGDANETDAEVKEDKAEKGAGIWDLY